jgi:hypothetical protein
VFRHFGDLNTASAIMYLFMWAHIYNDIQSADVVLQAQVYDSFLTDDQNKSKITVSFCQVRRAVLKSDGRLVYFYFPATQGLFSFPNSSPNSTMQKEDSSSHQNADTYMEY